MKTILSAFKTWTQKKIKESITASTADWNENDSSKSSYVKNRTHWEEKTIATLVSERTVNISENGSWGKLSESCPMLTAGQTYIVVLNDTIYECIARSSSNYVIIGNGTIYGDGEIGNGEPFSCDSYDNGTIYLNVAMAGNYTISISTTQTVTHKLDKKYLDLPDNIATIDYVLDAISDTYTKDEVDEKINNVNTEIGNINESINGINTGIDNINEKINEAKDYILLNDAEKDGYIYKVEIRNGNLVSSYGELDDFIYTTGDDGTIKITGWKQTCYGNNSTIMLVPNDDNIIL